MIMRMISIGLLVCVTTSDALAQRDRPARFPAEKFSPHPVQPRLNAPVGLSSPTAPERGATTKDEQKRRWEERSRNSSTPPR